MVAESGPRITNNEALADTTPCLAATALSRAASSMSWRRHGFEAADYRLTGARGWGGQAPGWINGGRTPNRILHGAECRRVDRVWTAPIKSAGPLPRCRLPSVRRWGCAQWRAGCRRPGVLGGAHCVTIMFRFARIVLQFLFGLLGLAEGGCSETPHGRSIHLHKGQLHRVLPFNVPSSVEYRILCKISKRCMECE